MKIGFGLGIIPKYKKTKQSFSIFLYHQKENESVDHKKMLAMKNKYQGKRAFIVCNGPSLRAEDLDKLQANKEISYGSNKVNKIFTKTKWRPTFYAAMDAIFEFPINDLLNEYIESEAIFVSRDSFLNTRKAKGNVIWLNTERDRVLLEDPRFAADCTYHIYTIATVTYSLMQLAVHMGATELYIIGCDNSYAVERAKDGTVIKKEGQQSYFAGADSSSNNNIGATWEMNVAYEYARKWTDKYGIKIYNATRGGHLEAFERIDFDSLF